MVNGGRTQLLIEKNPFVYQLSISNYYYCGITTSMLLAFATSQLAGVLLVWKFSEIIAANFLVCFFLSHKTGYFIIGIRVKNKKSAKNDILAQLYT